MLKLLLTALFLLLSSAVAQPARAAADWKAVDAAQKAGKAKKALGLAETILAEAMKSGDEPAHAEALVRVLRLELALGRYETALASFRTKRWPKARPLRDVLEIHLAHALLGYAQEYSYQIRRRVRVARRDDHDVATWSSEELHAEAMRALGRAWRSRSELGEEGLKTWSRYLEPGTYPREIRGTLRDAVTYLAASTLADTSYWKPEEIARVHELSPAELVGKAAASDDGYDLGKEAEPPLLRAVTALSDLEAWHADAGRDAAALEAFIERARLVAAAVGEGERRAVVREALRNRVESAKSP